MGFAVLALFIVCAVYVQCRGKVRHPRWSRRLTDHSNFLGPLNCLFYLFSKVDKQPYIDLAQFPELKVLQDNWQVIRDEALALKADSAIKASDALDDAGFNSFFKTGWKRYYLRWYGGFLGSAQRSCPKTVELLSGIDSVKGAMFASLPPDASLVRHRDPYAGSLRYHLGLVTPNDERCFISVDGERYAWRDGEAVMFDETYIHHAENNTDSDRIILFLDIRRPVSLPALDWLNSAFSNLVMAASATKNEEGDKVGAINRAFAHLYKIRILGKKIKAFNRTGYYALQYGLYGLLVYGLFF